MTEEGTPKPDQDADKIAKCIALGAFLAGVYFLDKLLADEKYVKDQNDQLVKVKVGILDDIFD